MHIAQYTVDVANLEQHGCSAPCRRFTLQAHNVYATRMRNPDHIQTIILSHPHGPHDFRPHLTCHLACRINTAAAGSWMDTVAWITMRIPSPQATLLRLCFVET